MPKVMLDPTQRIVQRLISIVQIEMKNQKVTQKEMAMELGLSSQAALSHKFINKSFTIVEIVKMLSVLGLTLDDLKGMGL